MSDSLHHEGWVRASLDLSEDAVEAATALLLAEGASGIEVQDAETFASADLPPGGARVITFFGGESPEAVRLRLDAALVRAEIEATLVAEEFTDESWKHKWKAFFEPRHVSARLAVAPPWDVPARPDGVKTVIIEPGLAFGTGTHATTLLCLSWLDELLQDVPTPSFASMLDVGCGSGILSIAAAKLSPTLAIDALDTDPEAHRVSRDNFAVNGVDARVRLADSGVLAELQGSYELVVANILAHILNFLSKDLVRVTSPGGSLLLSGIGEDSVRGVLETFEGLDMDVVDRREREGWTALLLKHRNPGRG